MGINITEQNDNTQIPGPLQGVLRMKKKLPSNSESMAQLPTDIDSVAASPYQANDASPEVKSTKPVVQEEAIVPKVGSIVPETGSPDTSESSIPSVLQNLQQPKPSIKPELAKQGSSNPVKHFLQRITGQVGPNPAPGEEYSGPVSGKEKSANLVKAGEMFGRVGRDLGYAITAAGGGQHQQAQAMEGIEAEPKNELQLAALQNNLEYKRAVVANNARKTTDAEQKEEDQYGSEGTSRIGAEARQHSADVAQQNADQNAPLKKAQTGLADANTNKVNQETQGNVPVDPQVAQIVGRPDLAGKPVGVGVHKQIEAALHEKGLKYQDLGTEGLYLVDGFGNKLKRVGESPSLGRAKAFGMYRGVQEIDPDTGNARFNYLGNAVSEGAAPAQIGSQIMSKQAQFKDIYSGLGMMRHAVSGIQEEQVKNGQSAEALPATAIAKLTLASRSTEPTILHSLLDTVMGSEQLSPAQRDFVTAQGQLMERILSIRNLAGIGGSGSDQLRNAIQATLATAKSGNFKLMQQQLDATNNLVDNLYAGVPQVNVRGAGGNQNRTASPPPSLQTPIHKATGAKTSTYQPLP